MFFLTELQNRPDGITNSSIKGYPTFATGLAQFIARASVAITTTDFTGVALTLQDEHGNILKNEFFETKYVDGTPIE